MISFRSYLIHFTVTLISHFLRSLVRSHRDPRQQTWLMKFHIGALVYLHFSDWVGGWGWMGRGLLFNQLLPPSHDCNYYITSYFLFMFLFNTLTIRSANTTQWSICRSNGMEFSIISAPKAHKLVLIFIIALEIPIILYRQEGNSSMNSHRIYPVPNAVPNPACPWSLEPAFLDWQWFGQSSSSPLSSQWHVWSRTTPP